MAGQVRDFLHILEYSISDNGESIGYSKLLRSPGLFGFRGGEYSIQTSGLFLVQTIVFVYFLALDVHNSEGDDPSVKYFFSIPQVFR